MLRLTPKLEQLIACYVRYESVRSVRESHKEWTFRFLVFPRRPNKAEMPSFVVALH